MPNDPPCYNGVDQFDASLGIFLCVGTFISFLPQHYSLLRRRSHVGISFLWLWINNFGNFCNTFADVLDQWAQIECCSRLGPWRCTKTLLVFLQLGINWACIFFVFILAVVFFKYNGTQESYNQRLTARLGFILYVLVAGFGAGTAFVLLLFMGGDSAAVKSYAYILAIVSAIIPVFVWTPQLYTTYKMKGPGSLSLTMQVIQTPGSFIQAFFQIWSGEWLVGITAVVSGMEQALLVCMCFYFLGRDWWRKRQEAKDASSTQPLLNDEEEAKAGFHQDKADKTHPNPSPKMLVIEEIDQDAPA